MPGSCSLRLKIATAKPCAITFAEISAKLIAKLGKAAEVQTNSENSIASVRNVGDGRTSFR